MWINRLFKLTHSKTSNLNALKENKEKFIQSLTVISRLLYDNENIGQANFLLHLIELIKHRDFSSFIKEINSVDMWGGSGAVWEVYIENRDTEREFQRNLLELISLMEETQIIDVGIKPLKKLFQRNLEN